MIEDQYIFYFKTVQTNPIRILFESLKNILSDVTFHVDLDGMKLTAVDGTKSSIVNLFLDSSKFEKFHCQKAINIGVNLTSIFKIVKSIKNADTISFQVEKDNSNYLTIETVNSDKKAKIKTSVKLLDLDEQIINIPDIDFDYFITMPSSDFQNYISDLSIISNELKISSNVDEFILSAKGDFAETSISIEQTNIKTKENLDKTSQNGVYNIKYLQLFSKSSNLCGSVEIYIKNEFPLTLIYNVANLGQIKYCLAPN